ncbi:MAG: carboxypeptidase regulatory-like domain-containing protein [Gemmatimonadetes bacterium]|nr:carboxypeptidase regulatory-like domain-containing protein [Gemmatimonadota bacterium]
MRKTISRVVAASALNLGLLLIFAAVAHAQAGSVRGTVTLAGAAPAIGKLTVTKDQEVCGESLPSRAVVVADGRVQYAIAYLDLAAQDGAPRRATPAAAAASGAKDSGAASQPLTITNRGCAFDPPVVAAVAGTKLTVRNEDPVFHNVRIRLGPRSMANLSLPVRGVQIENQRALTLPGVLTVKCDAHEWMEGTVRVFDHPYFAVTGADGSFEIAGVPPGKYTLVVWHAKLGEQRREITVAPGESLTVALTLPSASGGASRP